MKNGRGAERSSVIHELDLILASPADGPRRLAPSSVEAAVHVRALHRERARGGDAAARARGDLAHLARQIVDPFRERRSEQARVLGLGSRVESALNEWRSSLVPTRTRERLHASFGRLWNLLSFSLSLVAVGAVLVEHFLLASVSLSLRVMLSAFFFTPGLPADLSIRTRFLRVSWAACVGAHLADSLVLGAIGIVLVRSGSLFEGVFVVFVAQVLLASTLGRVAALQDGHWLPRLQLERVMRMVSLIGGLTAASIFQPEVPKGGLAIITTSAVGALGFAAIESLRTAHYEQMRRSGGYIERLAAIALAIERSDRSEPDRLAA